MLCIAAAPATCPHSIEDAGSSHILNNVWVFDGPPERNVSQIGDGMDRRGVWHWSTRYIDPYLVCDYGGTRKTLTFHAAGAKSCASGIRPDRGYCR